MVCMDSLLSPDVRGIRCTVNTALGREGECRLVPTKKARKVLVVGGGPAGMEAARVAALRGHRVTLYEKETTLGGQLNLAAIPPHKDRIEPLTRYLETQLRKLGVEIETGKEVTTALVEKLKPEVVILATGVTAFTPEIPGLNKARAIQSGDVLAGKVEAGDKVIVIGGELVGCETAEFLAEKGKSVTVTRRGPEVATGVGPVLRPPFLDRLSSKGVTLLPGVKYNEVTPQGLSVTTKEGETKLIEADTIVLAAGARSNMKLYEELKGKALEVHVIGDCVEPRTIQEAIADGFSLALEI